MKNKKPNNNRAVQNKQLSGNERIVNRTNQRRKKNRRKKIIIYSLLCFVFLCVGIALVLTMFFDINTITVSGESAYSDEKIIEASGIKTGDNLILVSKQKANELITTQLPYIGSAEFKRRLPSKLEIIVKRTDPVYAAAKDGYYIILDENGKVLETGLEYIGENLILLKTEEIVSAETGKIITLTNEKALGKLKEVREACIECGLSDITAVDLSNIYNIKLEYQGRITLVLGETDSGNLLKKLDLGKAAIETQNKENSAYRGTINLTVPGQGAWLEETVTAESTTQEEPPQDGNTDASVSDASAQNSASGDAGTSKTAESPSKTSSKAA
ncbi:MAG: cell division protein FtsQ/DivIB [Candidatus Fimenecus sp.]